ncbi:hypothetical protein HU200_038882 [Digitaria exilis]|uniref:Cyclin N-terminal domain-containing protein n=1 Tax=Digitaria exilis TaxID=1010633 RepID=A0A835BAY8_9POAL|nr:hypothetical protein HU200_038882 [Digitaria exilis]CAB3450096.1 unnamed protein product [Digitaria exilis]
MCSIAPFLPPGFADVPAATWCRHGYVDDDADIGALLRGIDAVVRQPKPSDLPKPSMDFLAQSRRHGDHGANFRAMLIGIHSIRVPPPGLMDAQDATPTTPVAVLEAPRSYGDDDDAAKGDTIATIKTTLPKKKQRDCGAEYDADIDAAFRVMETDPMERPSTDYLSHAQAGAMMMTDRAELIKKMHRFSRHYDLAPGALHPAVSYVDRFLSVKKITGGDRHGKLLLLGATAVFAAAKYEDRATSWRINADDVALYAGTTRSEVLDAERELVAALGYRLSGPTAYTFVDHFMRHHGHGDSHSQTLLIKSLAHHLADMALLDYRCVAFLPSAVAAAAIFLARLVLGCCSTTAPVAGYVPEDVSECMEAIYEMHENLPVWPGCAEMMADFELTTRLTYSMPHYSALTCRK